MKGLKVTIPGTPPTYKDGVIAYKPRPHITSHPDVEQYRAQVRQAVEELYSGNFKVDVIAEFDFYLPNHRKVNVSGMQYMVSSALCPVAVSHVGHIVECSTRLHYGDDNPRTVVTLRPKLTGGQQTL